jgi:hypothetical protein
VTAIVILERDLRDGCQSPELSLPPLWMNILFGIE